MLTGDIKRYEEFARGDLQLCRRIGTPVISDSYSYVGLAHVWRGRFQEAVESFREAARLEPPGFLAGLEWGYFFLGKAYGGGRQEALAMLGEKRGHLPRLGRANTWGAWTMLLAVVEGLAILGESREAGEIYPLVLAAIDTGAVVRWPTYGLLQTVAGMAAAAGGQWEKAEEHYRTALRQAHEIPVVVEQPEVRRWYARMLIDRDGLGDRAKAHELLTEAIAMYRQIGMPKHVEMAETLVRGL
jgi:tetratricopeptide (TPR) repeat protein